MRARTAFAITALFAALTVARGMEFDLVDRYARASRATRQPPTTRAPSTTINGAASSGFPPGRDPRGFPLTSTHRTPHPCSSSAGAHHHRRVT